MDDTEDCSPVTCQPVSQMVHWLSRWQELTSQGSESLMSVRGEPPSGGDGAQGELPPVVCGYLGVQWALWRGPCSLAFVPV